MPLFFFDFNHDDLGPSAPDTMGSRHALQIVALHRLVFLPMGIAHNRVRPHCHWTDVHRVHLKTRRDFTVSKIAPAISFTQPFPTVLAV
jgi:hypothetical protein